MGMLGGYCAHFYCDCCNAFLVVEGIGIETYSDAIKGARGFWRLKSNGVVLCDKCKDLKNPTLIHEDKREGGEWNYRRRK